MSDVYKNITWNRVPFVHLASTAVPPISGIYAYANIETVGSLPINIEWIYIGKAQELKRRIKQHEDFREPNVNLVRWIRSTINAELWYSATPLDQISAIERMLVARLKPRLNRILYKGENI